LDAELGRPPTQDETARSMGISQDRYNQLTRLSQLGREIHFSTLTNSGGAEGPKAPGERTWDIGDPHQHDPSDRMNRLMVTDYITRGLTRDERLVLILYYHEELTMSEIGLVLSLSESRVSQIHKDVIERLRKRFASDAEREQLVA
jgi:RNA polymerase sigma factor for flagellar operon FliA